MTRTGSTIILKTRLLFLLSIIIIVTVPSFFSSASQTYVGSKNSDVYHYPSCHYVDNIKPENLIYFSSPEEAIAAGYRPCQGCNPPTSSNGDNGKDSSSISCTVSPSNLELGEALMVSGSINPTRIGVTVTLQYTKPMGSIMTRTTTSDSSGNYRDSYTPTQTGTWHVLASWTGDSLYEGASSASQQFTVWSQSQSGDIEINQTTTCTSLVDGDSFYTLFGEIRLADIDGPEYYEDGYDDATNALSSLILDKPIALDIDDVYQMDYQGTGDRYVCVVYVEENATLLLHVNKYLVYYGYAEIDDFSNEFDPYAWALYYRKPSPSITCTVSPSTVIQGNALTVSGSLTPLLPDIAMTLRYVMPDDTIVEREVTTDIDGTYTDTYTPTILGVWDVVAEWDGSSLYQSTSSMQQSFTVLKSPSTISCSISQASIEIGDTVTLSGTLNLIRADEIITLSYRETGDWATLATVSTEADGSYTYAWTPSTLGSYQLQALWPGDTTYDAAQSLIITIDVTKISRSISCSTSISALTIGDSVILSGATTPSLSGETITVFYRDTGSWETLASVTSLPDGSYSYTWTPPSADTYQLQAKWPGDSIYADASSSITLLSVNKLSNAISCDASITMLSIDENLTLRGVVSPSRAGITVSLQQQTGVSWATFQSIMTNAEGSYTYVWAPPESGTYQLRAVSLEDDTYDTAVSTVVTITVTKLPTSISCTVLSSEVVEGNAVSVSGSLIPARPDVTMTLTYVTPDSSTITRTVTSDSNGDFGDSYTPDVVGSWSVTVSWDGDATYDSASSASKTFTIAQQSGCLIATATYDSELSPQVQFLRNFRDDRVLSTFAGRQFMEIFNSFYYSWSPNIADTIRAHDSVATMMKPVLYPLIGILQISEGIFSVLSFHPELAVIATGCVASALIAGIYLLPMTLLINYFRKNAVSRTLVSAIGIIWLASLCAIVLAELTQSSALMMTATGSFVLATMVATVLSMMNVLPAFVKKRVQS